MPLSPPVIVHFSGAVPELRRVKTSADELPGTIGVPPVMLSVDEVTEFALLTRRSIVPDVNVVPPMATSSVQCA